MILTYRMRIAGAALAAAMLAGGGGGALADSGNSSPNTCFGQHVRYTAQLHGGMASATDHFNQSPAHDDYRRGDGRAHAR